MSTTKKTIPLNRAVSIMEILLTPNHPFHPAALEMLAMMQKEAHEERTENGRRMMQDQIDGMDEDEMASFHRNHG